MRDDFVTFSRPFNGKMSSSDRKYNTWRHPMPTKPQPKHAILSAYQDEPELASLSAHPPAGRRGAFKALFKPAALAVACTLFLAACSSSNDPGSLIEASQAVGTLPRAALDASSAAALVGAAAKCDVQVIGLNYLTRGVNGEPTNASGVLLMPSGSDAACKGPLPLLAYGRGTEVSKGRALASLSDGESGALAAFFAGQGYAVVASDYLGYAKSAYSYHPYLHSDTEASATIDAIRAARQVAREKGQALSGKLMLYGYSQGGHSSRNGFGCGCSRGCTLCTFNRAAGRRAGLVWTDLYYFCCDSLAEGLWQCLCKAQRCLQGALRRRHRVHPAIGHHQL
ncbi:MAG: hypothetical protein EBS52_02935 [Betaproteobacteria bacterium]|nr:hypothetical protein [Betaproteobacteria bacterium]